MIETKYHDFSVDPVRRLLAERVEALQNNEFSDMPAWVKDDPQHALEGKKLIICGSHMPGEIRHVARRHEVVAIVDDFLCQKEEAFMGIPLITTDTWVVIAKKDPSIVTLLFVSSATGYNHFLRCIAENELQWLGTLDYFRLHDGRERNLAGAGITFVYGLPFFRHTVANFDAHLRCAELLDDDYSRFTLFCLLNYRLTADPNYLSRCSVGYNTDRFARNSYIFNRSFHQFSETEVFVDGGAFDGDSIEQFLRATRGKFQRIYSFEPSPDQANKCRQRIRRLQTQCIDEIASRISILEKGLWDSRARLFFNPNLFAGNEMLYADSMPLAGHIVEAGFSSHMYHPEAEALNTFAVDTTTVDEASEEAATFIKLEVEGSELQALRGAARTISRMRPKMSLAVYHKPEDYLTLTDYVNKTESGYRMSIRQHNPLVPDATVCYCYY